VVDQFGFAQADLCVGQGVVAVVHQLGRVGEGEPLMTVVRGVELGDNTAPNIHGARPRESKRWCDVRIRVCAEEVTGVANAVQPGGG